MKVASEYRERNFKNIRATCVTGGNEEDNIRGADSCGPNCGARIFLTRKLKSLKSEEECRIKQDILEARLIMSTKYELK